jgi:alpha-mannosidase
VPARDGLVGIEPQSVIVTAVKKADDDDRIVLRFYEWSGRPADVRIRLRDPIERANETNLMEQEGAVLPIENETISVSTRPHEVKTIAVRRRTR